MYYSIMYYSWLLVYSIKKFIGNRPNEFDERMKNILKYRKSEDEYHKLIRNFADEIEKDNKRIEREEKINNILK